MSALSPPLDQARQLALERAIVALLQDRAEGATICPSEAARAVHATLGPNAPPDGWRDLMPTARHAAARLAARGEVLVTQRGSVVDVATARGPVRIRLATSDP